MMLLVVHTDRK